MKYKLVNEQLIKEEFKLTPGSLGANSVDLVAAIDEPIELYPGQQVLIPTGISVALSKNTIGMLLPRSGKGVKGLVLGNLVGNIDPDYRGEVKACLWNRNTEGKPIEIKPMDKIVQFVVTPVEDPNYWELVTELNDTERGSKGFGSTGE